MIIHNLKQNKENNNLAIKTNIEKISLNRNRPNKNTVTKDTDTILLYNEAELLHSINGRFYDILLRLVPQFHDAILSLHPTKCPMCTPPYIRHYTEEFCFDSDANFTGGGSCSNCGHYTGFELIRYYYDGTELSMQDAYKLAADYLEIKPTIAYPTNSLSHILELSDVVH